MKRCILVLLAVCFFAVPVFAKEQVRPAAKVDAAPVAAQASLPKADDPKALELARQLIGITGGGEVGSAALSAIPQLYKNALQRANPDKTTDNTQIMDMVTPVLLDSTKDYQDRLAKIYTASMTADELQQVISFYKSPVGQKYAQLSLDFRLKAQQLSSQFVQDVNNKIIHIITEQIAKRGLKVPKELGGSK